MTKNDVSAVKRTIYTTPHNSEVQQDANVTGSESVRVGGSPS